MKKLFITTSLLLATTAAQAGQYHFVSTDDSALSAMCIAATESHEAFVESARTHGLNASEFDTLYCNGMRLDRFVDKYRAPEQAADRDAAPRYVFSKTNDTALTALCLAALSSPDTYLQVKQQYFSGDSRVGEELTCNGMPLKNFVRRYGNKGGDFTASLR